MSAVAVDRRRAPIVPLTDEDRRAVTEIAPRVRALVFATYGSGHHAAYTPEDVFQATMEAVCRARPRWDPAKASWPTFALNRAKFHVVDFLREQRQGRRGTDDLEPISLDARLEDRGPAILDFLATIDPEPADPFLERQLLSAVDRLSPVQAATFRLYAEGGLTLLEIANLYGVTESAIYRRLADAREHLAHLTRPYLEPVAA